MKSLVIMCILGCIGLQGTTAETDDILAISSTEDMDKDNATLPPGAEDYEKDWNADGHVVFPREHQSQESMSYDTGRVVFTYFFKVTSFKDAENHCKTRFNGGHLASVHNQYINQLLTTLSRRSPIWIGGKFYKTAFQWTDKTRWDYSNWTNVYPASDRRCVSINKKTVGGWSNFNCRARMQFVCQHSH